MTMASQVSPKTPRLSTLIKTHIRYFTLITTTTPRTSTSTTNLEKSIRTQCLSGEINLEEALFYLDCLSESRHSYSSYTFDYLLASISKLGHHSLAISRFRALFALRLRSRFRPRTGTLNVILRCYCLLRRPDLAFAVVAAMLKLGPGPDARALAELLRALFALGAPRDALALFRKAREIDNSVEEEEKEEVFLFLCDEFVYGVVIDGLCKFGEVSEALEILRTMKLRPDAACFAPVVDALCRAGDADAALQVYEEMSGTVDPASATVVTTSLVAGLCRLGRSKDAKRILLANGGSEEAYNAAADTLLKAGEWREAVSVFEAMVRAQVRPTEVIFTSLLCGLARCDRPGEALQLLGVMTDRYNLRPTPAVLAAISRALCRADRPAEALAMVDRLASNPGAAVVAYNHALHGCFRAGLWRQGFELAERMVRDRPNTVTFTVLAAGLCKQGRAREAIPLFKDMVVRGLVPDRATRAVLKTALAERSPAARAAANRHHPNHRLRIRRREMRMFRQSGKKDVRKQS